MTPNEKREFVSELYVAFETARQPLPSAAVLSQFWARLEPYPLHLVLRAISKHLDASEFAPTPAGLLKHLPAQSDGRPEVDEAWAIALRSRDERETVVWTTEIAEAFGIAKSVLDGDEIGARMAFKAAYARITDASRRVNRPVEWVVSQGHDATRRLEVVEQAVREGRLALTHAQAAVPLLAGPSEDVAESVDVEANLARMRAIVAGARTAMERSAAERSRRTREATEDLAEAKRETARRVAAYEGARV